MSLRFNEEYSYTVISKNEIDEFINANQDKIKQCLNGKIGLQNFLGWFEIVRNTSEEILNANKEIAKEIQKEADVFVLVGVGGSNRASQSLIEGFPNMNRGVEILYGGNNVSSAYILSLLEKLQNKSVYINVVAKDFNTLEPGITFRVLRKFMHDLYGDAYKKRVILTGSYGSGQLYELAKAEGFRFLEFPKEVGGRFSAFTSVSFLPMLVAGIDIERFINGGLLAEKMAKNNDLIDNNAVRYAVARHLLFLKGFIVENLVSFEPSMDFFSKWALQLHAESEGKNDNAILPITTSFSEDLHAIGQYIQDAKKNIFETFLEIRNTQNLLITSDGIKDGFDYLNNKQFDLLNEAVLQGSKEAHNNAGIPILSFSHDEYNEEVFGELMYTFMISSYISSSLIGAEPLDQPGVEAYKKSMYRILEKKS